jgi:hypothetical protein
MRLSPVLRCIVFPLAALIFTAAAAKAANYQIIITPELNPNFFFAPGEPSDEFTSDFQDIDFTGSLAPPQFLQAVITFSAPSIDTSFTDVASTASVDIPEANPLSNIPLGTNLVGGSPWSVHSAFYTITPPGDDAFNIDLDTGTQGLDQEWTISLNFPTNSDGNGTALSGSIVYYDNDNFNGNNNATTFVLNSAVISEIVPEPASLTLLSCLGLGLLRRKRRFLLASSTPA